MQRKERLHHHLVVDPMFLPPPPRKMRSPALDPAMLARLAKIFAEAIPEGEFSVAALQGYLLKNKSWPEAAVKSSRHLQGCSPRESLIIDKRHDNIESMHKTRKKIIFKHSLTLKAS
ncbi:hypothetical protein K439DRAFT_1566284 [Ramaria rubella]|nr:hypothetical protein K439DRAFT_1566284 [Ramaria rubella]